MTTNLLFENVTCGRCGGSGKYSYNMMHGSTCYGCAGKGVVLTKRGIAAQKFLNSLRKIPANKFKVGDLMLCEGVTSACFAKITEIKTGTASEFGYADNTTPFVGLYCGDKGGIVCSADTLVRKGFSGAEKDAQKKLALEYQATLTKTGTVRK